METDTQSGFVNLEETSDEDLSSEAKVVEDTSEPLDHYEDEEIMSSETYSSVRLETDTQSGFVNLEETSDEDFSAEEFYRENGDEKSRIEELTEFDGQLDLFDTFEPEELESEKNIKDPDESFSLTEGFKEKEIQQDILNKDNIQKDLSITDEIKELKEKNNDVNFVTKNVDENNLLVDDKSTNKHDSNSLEEHKIFDEAVNAVFGEKKATDIDTWARREAEAMSARAEEGARMDYQKESQKKIELNDNNNVNFRKGNDKPSMKELKKDLKSLSELINSVPVKIKDSDKKNN